MARWLSDAVMMFVISLDLAVKYGGVGGGYIEEVDMLAQPLECTTPLPGIELYYCSLE